jgi:chromate transport protein ChrA
MSTETINKLLSDDVMFLLVGGTIAIVAIVFTTVSSMVRSTARERSRREIAAYIAEGSMSPEQGEKLMAAGLKKDGCA